MQRPIPLNAPVTNAVRQPPSDARSRSSMGRPRLTGLIRIS